MSVVDDHAPTQRVLAQQLTRAGYAPAVAGRGAEALVQARADSPDLVLLDLMLPDIDGLAVCRALRAESTLPILVLSGISDERQQVALLDAGADDYLIKPVRRELLLARIRRALVRSARGADAGAPMYRLGDLVVDVARHQVRWAGAVVALSPTEWALLLLLLQAPAQTLSFTQLCAQLWPGDAQRPQRALQPVINRLRQKLVGIGIVSVRGVGYCLEPVPAPRHYRGAQHD